MGERVVKTGDGDPGRVAILERVAELADQLVEDGQVNDCPELTALVEALDDLDQYDGKA